MSAVDPPGRPIEGSPPGVGDVHEHVRRLAQGWDHREEDISRLLDRAAASLAQEANHELRQILTMVFTQLELAAHSTPGAGAQLDEDTLARLTDAVDRGANVVETYLDRREIAKALIQLDREPLDLQRLASRYFEVEPLDPSDERIEIDADPVHVRADREKLYRVFSFLASSLWRVSPDGGRLRVEIEDGDGTARCFVGVEPCPVDREALMARLVEQLTIDELKIDVPYARAIIERHGGIVFVDDRDEGHLGYGFELPALEGSA